MTELYDSLVRGGMSTPAAKALSEIPLKMVRVDARRPFREVGHARDEVMFIQSGLIAKFKPDGSGRRQIVALRFPGERILPANAEAPYGMQAITSAEVMVGKEEDLYRIIGKHPEIARHFMSLIQQQEEIGYEWLLNCGRRDSVARVAHLLCETAQRMKIDIDSEPMRNPFTQQQVADITGQTSVNVNRVFAELERRGVIRREARKIFFEDAEELRRIAGFHPEYLKSKTRARDKAQAA